VEPPEYLYHGTADRSYTSIMENGIKKAGHQHVHLSKDKETAHKVGSPGNSYYLVGANV